MFWSNLIFAVDDVEKSDMGSFNDGQIYKNIDMTTYEREKSVL